MAPPSKPSSSGGSSSTPSRHVGQRSNYNVTGHFPPNNDVGFPPVQQGRQNSPQHHSQPQQQQPDVRYRPRPSEHDERPVMHEDTKDTVDGIRVHSSHLNVSYTQQQVESSTPDLFRSFVIDRMESEGYDVPPTLGRRLEKESEVASHLRRIGDDIARDKHLNRLIGEIKVTPETMYETFYSVASQIFEDGTIHWGRVVMLFYFAFKLLVQVVSQGQLIDKIIEWVTKFVVEKLASWIASRGGWTSIREYFGSTTPQLVGVFLAGIILSSIFWYYKK